MKNENEIRDYFFFGKEELDDHFDRELTTEDLDDLREKISGMDRDVFMYWILDYLSWTPNEENK
jgi:hypothetical protein